jgi:hypothetical protein
MVTVGSSTDRIYQTYDDYFSSVVKISSNGYYGTGTLLYDGSTILTAAHVFEDDVSPVSIDFDLSNGERITLNASDVLIHPLYDEINTNNDLALVFLDEIAPIEAPRYDIYRNNDEIDQTFIASGYGALGTGYLGYNENSEILRLKSYNSFDILGDELDQSLGYLLPWTPDENILVADFDDGTYAHDALGQLSNRYDFGLGVYEGLIAPGDSGGPAFIDGKVAGVASYTATLNTSSNTIDVDDKSNSSFGELGFWQRVSSFDEWIDKSIRENYSNAPTTKEEVNKEVLEGDLGDNPVVYFLVELLNASTFRTSDIYSVEYETKDGSATAYEDYIPVSGTLRIYDDESYAVIPVQIISDDLYEGDETFSLEISNPQGGTFLSGVSTLSAERTILEDDLIV